MAFTRAQFYVRFDCFDLTDFVTAGGPFPNTVQDAKVDAFMAGAEAQTDRTLFPTVAQADECIMYLVATLLARDPSAMNSRMQKSRGDDNLHLGEDVYRTTYERLARGVVAGYGIT